MQDPDGRWILNFAQRIESFSDFGLTANGKMAARLSLSDEFAVRGAVSSGFRAPTPGQQNAFNISTIYDPDIMDLTNNGTIPSTSDLAVLYGGESLQPEKSINFSLGAVLEQGGFSFSTDYFFISVYDRLTTSKNFTLSTDDIDRLLNEGIIRPGGVLKRFPLLHQRLRDPDAGDRRRGRVQDGGRAGQHHREQRVGTSPPPR